MSGEFQTVSALHLKLFQGQWLFKRKLSSGARRNGENSEKRMNLSFTMLIFAWSMTVRVEVGLQQCHRKVFEGRSSARQFPSLATLMYYTSKIFDR